MIYLFFIVLGESRRFSDRQGDERPNSHIFVNRLPFVDFLIVYYNSFYSLPCDLIQVGYRDALGNERSDIDNEIFKTNLDVNGNPIGQRDKTKVFISFSHSFSNR